MLLRRLDNQSKQTCLDYFCFEGSFLPLSHFLSSLWAPSTWLWSPGWPWTHNNLSASASWCWNCQDTQPQLCLFLINVTRSWSRAERTQLSISSWEAGATVEIQKLLFFESAKIGISCQGVLGNHFQEPKACSLSVLRDTRKTNN